MLIDNTYLANSAFRGLVIDKIYKTEEELSSDKNNIVLGRYVLVIGESNDNKVYQRVWRKDGAPYEFITSLSPLSENEEENLKARQDARIDEFFKVGDVNSAGQQAINDFGIKGDEAIEAFNLRLTASEKQIEDIEKTINITEENFDEIAKALADDLESVISSYTLKWQTH